MATRRRPSPRRRSSEPRAHVPEPAPAQATPCPCGTAHPPGELHGCWCLLRDPSEKEGGTLLVPMITVHRVVRSIAEPMAQQAAALTGKPVTVQRVAGTCSCAGSMRLEPERVRFDPAAVVRT